MTDHPIAKRPRVMFRNQILYVTNELFVNGNTCLCLTSPDGSPAARCSVNVGRPMPEHLTYIKDYSENAGIAEVLVDAGLIVKTNRMQHSGFVDLQQYSITQKLADALGLHLPSTQDETISRLGDNDLELEPVDPPAAPVPKRSAKPKAKRKAPAARKAPAKKRAPRSSKK